MDDIFFNKNKFIGPLTIIKKCGRGGKGTKIINTLDLSDGSGYKITVECKHGQRIVKWKRRHHMCPQCCLESGVYNTSPKGRVITWGNKISEAKKGVKATEQHKTALILARKHKIAKRLNIEIDKVTFPTSGPRSKIRRLMMSCLKKHIWNHTTEWQDKFFIDKMGYTADELCKHLEAKFQPGMTWENHGNYDPNVSRWQIDHVIPDSWFQYESIEDQEFKNCWALSNMQPMWAIENRQKSNFYSGAFKEKTIYLLCGQHGVGKSTIASQLTDIFNVIDDDDYSVKARNSFIATNWHKDKPILLQIGIHISTTIKRYVNKGYNVIPFFIIENPETVKNRIIGRGGSRINNVDARYVRMVSIAKEFSVFTSDADTMIGYLKEYGKE